MDRPDAAEWQKLWATFDPKAPIGLPDLELRSRMFSLLQSMDHKNDPRAIYCAILMNDFTPEECDAILGYIISVAERLR